MTESTTVSEKTTHRVRTRDAIAAATVWLPFLAYAVTLVMWSGSLPAEVTLRNDVNSSAAAVLPMWGIAAGVGVVLLGLGLGAVSVVPERNNSAETRRVPLFWAGAVAGVVCATWMFQSWGAMVPPDDPARANALAGFATIGAAVYGLLPFFIAHRPTR